MAKYFIQNIMYTKDPCSGSQVLVFMTFIKKKDCKQKYGGLILLFFFNVTEKNFLRAAQFGNVHDLKKVNFKKK